MPKLQLQHITYKLSSPQRNIQTKYVAHMSLTATGTMVCCCCHGNKMLPWFAVVPRNMCTKYEACML